MRWATNAAGCARNWSARASAVGGRCRFQRQGNGCDGEGCQAFAASDKTQAFRGGRLQADAIESEVEDVGDPLSHLLAEGANFGCFRKNSNIDVANAALATLDAAAGIGEKLVG